MGAWGYGPLDNDLAADWIDENLVGLLEQTIAEADTAEEVLAAMHVALLTDAMIGFEDPEAVLTRFGEVEASDSSMEWTDPAERARVLTRMKSEISAIVMARREVDQETGPRVAEDDGSN